jgi:hypothetical protein
VCCTFATPPAFYPFLGLCHHACCVTWRTCACPCPRYAAASITDCAARARVAWCLCVLARIRPRTFIMDHASWVYTPHPTHRCFLCAHEVATRPRRERTGKRVACCPARLHAPPLRVILQPPRVILHLFISCSCVLCFALFLCVWALFCLLGLCPPRGQDRRRRPPKAVR